jgi:hypothetical protein
MPQMWILMDNSKKRELSTDPTTAWTTQKRRCPHNHNLGDDSYLDLKDKGIKDKSIKDKYV